MHRQKEISVAIIIGLVISALIIGGIYRAKTAIDAHLQRNTSNQAARTSNPTTLDSQPGEQESLELPLNITEPVDGAVVDVAKIELKGNTFKEGYVTILTDNREFIIVPTETGSFSQELTLIRGANTIVVTVYNSQGDRTTQILNVVYTTADL
jgi:hypothetical protein